MIATAAPPVPSVGEWVGPREEPARYERLEHIGGGGEGTVYHGRFVGLGGGTPASVALKQYRPPSGASPDWPHDGTWLQLRDQAGVLAGLPASAHLVKVREVFLGAISSARLDADPSSPQKAFATPFVVMEWIDGRTVDAELSARSVPLPERLRWVGELAEALDLLHSLSRTQGNPLVHGDVKPANCLIAAGRGLVLIDTGALHRVDGDRLGRGLRTPHYTAPEVFQSPGRPRSAAADLFSLGAVAFCLLTGRPPASAEQSDYLEQASAELRATSWVHRPWRRAGQRRARELILEALAPDPTVRAPRGAVAWARELTVALTGRRLVRRHRVIAAVLAACLVAVLFGANAYRQARARSGPVTTITEAARFSAFGTRWAEVATVATADRLTVTPPLGDNRYDHLWGVYLPTAFCDATVEFDVQAIGLDTTVGTGFGVAPRSSLPGDQPHGSSLQYEWQIPSVNPHPGSYVRYAELPGGAWEGITESEPAPDLRQQHHVKVYASGVTIGMVVDGRDIVAYDPPQVECGGVTIRTWGAGFTFSNVRVSGT